MKKFEKQILANDEKWLKLKYIDEMLSMRQISKICDVSVDTIRVRLNRFNIKLRSKKESNFNSAIIKPKHYEKTSKMKKKQELQKTGENVLCKNCGCSFYVIKSNISKRRFCSFSCYKKWKKENRKRQDEWRDTSEYDEWRKNVYKRDGWKCCICNSKNKINAHHIYYAKFYPKKRFDVSNGITLCEHHHIMLHKNECSFIKELIKKIPNIGETPEKGNPEASIRKILYALTTIKERPERTMV